MAAISIPPLRSTLHSGVSLPATVAQHNLPRTRIAKRQRDHSQDHDGPPAPKRQKSQDHAPSRPNTIILSTATANNAFKVPGTVMRDVVTQTEQSPKQNAVQPIVDHGSTMTSTGASITSQEKTVAKVPAKIIKQIEKRTLRSQDGGSRSKSDLALYFANYDDIVSNEPREPGTILVFSRTVPWSDFYRISHGSDPSIHHRRASRCCGSRPIRKSADKNFLQQHKAILHRRGRIPILCHHQQRQPNPQ